MVIPHWEHSFWREERVEVGAAILLLFASNSKPVNGVNAMVGMSSVILTAPFSIFHLIISPSKTFLVRKLLSLGF